MLNAGISFFFLNTPGRLNPGILKEGSVQVEFGKTCCLIEWVLATCKVRMVKLILNGVIVLLQITLGRNGGGSSHLRYLLV